MRIFFITDVIESCCEACLVVQRLLLQQKQIEPSGDLRAGCDQGAFVPWTPQRQALYWYRVSVFNGFLLYLSLLWSCGLHHHGELDERGVARKWYTVYYMEPSYSNIITAHIFLDGAGEVSSLVLSFFGDLTRVQLEEVTLADSKHNYSKPLDRFEKFEKYEWEDVVV